MRISKIIRCGCRWRPPADMDMQVLLTAALSKVLMFHVLRKDGTVNRPLMERVTRRVLAKKKSMNGVSSVDIPINSVTGMWCRIYVPTWVDPDKILPLIIYYHGGGFVLLHPDVKEYDSHCRRLAKMCEAVVVSASYRQAPDHKDPAAYDDGMAALEWVRSQSRNPHEDFPIAVVDFSRVFIAGDSAGGNLAHHVAVKAGTRDISPISLAGLILLQPFFGGEERTASEIRFKHGTMCELKELDWYWRAFLSPGSDRDHPSCNVCGPKSPSFFSMNLPKTLVVVGGKDPLQDRQIEYAEAMQSAGKDCKLIFYEKAFHSFYVFKSLRATRLLFYEIEEFVHPPADETRSVAGTLSPRASNSSFLDRILSW